ncbi:MAG: FMN-binding protein [Clostridiaceae bacterium]|jgi:electron transport complex protein RnfG|nr:FMN-binding protein [Clostridiaceae bacterium]
MPANKKTNALSRTVSIKERGPMPVLILTVICSLCVALLALTATMTADARERQANWLADKNKRALFPQADSFLDMNLEQAGDNIPGAITVDLTTSHPDVDQLIAVHKDGDAIGIIIRASSKAYGGRVPVMTGFDLAGRIIGIVVDASSETAGLGQKTAGDPFTDQFKERTADDAFADIDAISSATISSNSVKQSVMEASDALRAFIKKGGQ